MQKVAFVFPGQGSQVVGMGKALYERFEEARAVFDAADEALGEPLSRLCFEGPESALKLTANTQPAILVTSLAVHAVARSALPEPALLAGHSLGEYSALAAAGALRLADAVRTVRARGTFMQEAVPAGVGGMAAVLGMAAEDIRRVCDEIRGAEVLSPANYNEPGQTVIAGHQEAIARATVALKEAGARKVVPLPVSAPFHCALMAPVKPRLLEVLSGVEVSPLRQPVVSNVEAVPNADRHAIVPLLVEQVTAPVRWVECVESLVRHGVTRVYELGPGKVLCGLVRRIAPQLECVNIEDERSLERALAGAQSAAVAA